MARYGCSAHSCECEFFWFFGVVTKQVRKSQGMLAARKSQGANMMTLCYLLRMTIYGIVKRLDCEVSYPILVREGV